MNETTTETLFGQSPTRFGVISLISAGLAVLSWPLMVVIGFIMVYVAGLLALTAILSGLLGIGGGLYFQRWSAVLPGAIGAGLAVAGAVLLAAAASSF